MKLTTQQLIIELSNIVESSLAKLTVESYVEMQRRFIVGDWQPTELDGGRLCEAISRCLYQMDTGKVTHNKSVKDIREYLIDLPNSHTHLLKPKDRRHIAKAIEVVYKFRSDRGAVHISPDYDANFMDSMLVVHVGKWIFAEFLRLAWEKDRKVIADTIAQIVQLEHSLIHELDGAPLVLAKGISARDEVLLLLNHASTNRLSRIELRRQAARQSSQKVMVAVSTLLREKEIRIVADDDVALTPLGQKRIIEKIMPKYNPYV